MSFMTRLRVKLRLGRLPPFRGKMIMTRAHCAFFLFDRSFSFFAAAKLEVFHVARIIALRQLNEIIGSPRPAGRSSFLVCPPPPRQKETHAGWRRRCSCLLFSSPRSGGHIQRRPRQADARRRRILPPSPSSYIRRGIVSNRCSKVP